MSVPWFGHSVLVMLVRASQSGGLPRGRPPAPQSDCTTTTGTTLPDIGPACATRRAVCLSRGRVDGSTDRSVYRSPRPVPRPVSPRVGAGDDDGAVTAVPALPGVHLLLVDLDGPLVRLLPDPAHLELTERVREAVTARGVAVWPALAEVSDHVAALREIATRDSGLPQACATLVSEAELAAADSQAPYPDAVAFLADWLGAGRPAAVITNNDVDAARRVLDRAGLGDHVRAGALSVHGREGAAVARLKPEPDLLREALARHGVAPADALMVGDMASDVEAARAAGVSAIGVSDDDTRREELLAAGADRVVARLAALGDPPTDPAVERVVETVLPTRHGRFRMLGYRDHTGETHVALVLGLLDPPPGVAPLVRIHSECLTGDAFGSRRCDCGEQLQAALARIAAEGEGAVVYVRGHEGRGIGLIDKLRAYRLQDGGADTVDANLELGLGADLRTYDQAALILADLGVDSIRLMSSNPAKEEALRALGVEVVERTRLPVPDRPENHGYLMTKRERMGHDAVADSDVWQRLLDGVVPDATLDPLIDRYGPLVRATGPLVIGQLGLSLDGFIAARTGDAEFVTGDQDREHLHRLRALVDAVVVGAGTVATDDPQLTVRAVAGPNPVRVVLDPHARVPRDSRVLTDGAARTIWLVGPSAEVPARAAAPGVVAEHGAQGDTPPAALTGQALEGRVEVVRLPSDGDADPAVVLAVLRERGLAKVLVEGGGRVVSSFLAADLLDRLYLTTAPVLIGDGVPGLRFAGQDRLADALRAPTRRFVLGDDVCTELTLHP